MQFWYESCENLIIKLTVFEKRAERWLKLNKILDLTFKQTVKSIKLSNQQLF